MTLIMVEVDDDDIIVLFTQYVAVVAECENDSLSKAEERKRREKD